MGIAFLLLGEPVRGSLYFEIGTNTINRHRWCPNALGEGLPALLLRYDPMITSLLDSESQGGVSRWKQYPAFRCGQDFAIGCTDGVGRRAGGEGHC